MTARLSQWYLARSKREQRLLLLMALIAVPLIAWLLVVQPLGRAYDAALQEQLEAVDRNGRVRALAEAARQSAAAAPSVQSGQDLQLVVTESAGQAGVTLQSAAPAGAGSIDVAVEGAPAPLLAQWLRQLEAQGIQVQEMRMNPQPAGAANLSARLGRRG